MKDIKILFSEEEIKNRIQQIANQIDRDYYGKEIVVVSVLKGAIFFTVDLVKNIKTSIELETVQIASYEGTESTGKVNLKKDLDMSIEGKDVLIIEDIVDTGTSLKYLKEYFISKNPNSVKIAVLLDK